MTSETELRAENERLRVDLAHAHAEIAAHQQKLEDVRRLWLDSPQGRDHEAAVKAERARIRSIQQMVRPGFERLADSAIEHGSTVEQFALAMVREQADRGITLDAIRRDAPSPAPHAKVPDIGKPDAGKSWDDIHAKISAGRM